MLDFLRDNKLLSVIALLFLVLGIVLGVVFGPKDITVARKVIGGGIFGFRSSERHRPSGDRQATTHHDITQWRRGNIAPP